MSLFHAAFSGLFKVEGLFFSTAFQWLNRDTLILGLWYVMTSNIYLKKWLKSINYVTILRRTAVCKTQYRVFITQFINLIKRLQYKYLPITFLSKYVLAFNRVHPSWKLERKLYGESETSFHNKVYVMYRFVRYSCVARLRASLTGTFAWRPAPKLVKMPFH